MNKKERVYAAIAGKPVDFVPCGFSLHFPPEKNSGEAGVFTNHQEIYLTLWKGWA